MNIHKEYMEKHGLKESDFDNMPEIWNALNSVQDIIDKHESKAENLPIADVSHQREQIAISCLRNITDPIKYLKELAEADGAKLDGAMAIQMTRNGMFYQELANKALKEIDNCG